MPVSRPAVLAVTVAALGYLVDIYDLILFGVVRTPSLIEIGVAEADRLAVGNALQAWQMGGMLVGGILWGILGDKRGRLSVLFGSILLYSLANIANGFVADVETYKWLRFIAGVGLAGELGAGLTLPGLSRHDAIGSAECFSNIVMNEQLNSRRDSISGEPSPTD